MKTAEFKSLIRAADAGDPNARILVLWEVNTQLRAENRELRRRIAKARKLCVGLEKAYRRLGNNPQDVARCHDAADWFERIVAAISPRKGKR